FEISSFKFQIWGFVPALTALLLQSVVLAQQPKPSPTPASKGPYTFKVESELVLVNVVARDKSGKPVTDLKREDFTVLEDGKPQKLPSFYFETLNYSPLSARAGPNQLTIEGKPVAPSKPLLTRKDAEEALSNKRVIVLFFDLGSMDPDQTQRAVDAAKKYVQSKMTGADMIAIVSLASSLRLDQDFTNDQARLLRVLNPYNPPPRQRIHNHPT